MIEYLMTNMNAVLAFHCFIVSVGIVIMVLALRQALYPGAPAATIITFAMTGALLIGASWLIAGDVVTRWWPEHYFTILPWARLSVGLGFLGPMSGYYWWRKLR